jgi:hypothetical protein
MLFSGGVFTVLRAVRVGVAGGVERGAVGQVEGVTVGRLVQHAETLAHLVDGLLVVGDGAGGEVEGVVLGRHAVVAQAGEQLPVGGHLDQILGIHAGGDALELAGLAMRAGRFVHPAAVRVPPMVVVGLVGRVDAALGRVRAPRTIFFSQAKSTPVSTSCLSPCFKLVGGQVALGEQVLHALDLQFWVPRVSTVLRC